jgi:porin
VRTRNEQVSLVAASGMPPGRTDFRKTLSRIADTFGMVGRNHSSCVLRWSVFLLTLTIAQTLWAQTIEAEATSSVDSISAASQQSSPIGIPGLPDGGGIGGPGSVPSQLRGDLIDGPRYRLPQIDQALQPWLDFKTRLNKLHRFQLGADYNTLYQGATETLTGNDDAASGIFRVYGDWTLFGEADKTAGSLIAKGENRHRFTTDIPPSQLGFDAGYSGIPGVLFGDVGWAMTNLYWEQYLANGQAGFVIGMLEPDSYIDVSGYANPWTTFQNFAVVVNPTIPFPDPNFGAAAGIVFHDQWLIKGGVYDTNNVLSEFEFFSEGAELFSHVDVSWSPTRAERYLKEFHITGWHVDQRDNAGVPESHGIAVAGNWTFQKRWMPFFRAGWSEGAAPLMHREVTGGCLYYCADRGDLTGIAMTWEDPVDRTLNEQNTFELFYRYQLAKNFAITPSLQVLIDPALNPNSDSITVFGLRARMTF